MWIQLSHKMRQDKHKDKVIRNMHKQASKECEKAECSGGRGGGAECKTPNKQLIVRWKVLGFNVSKN